MGTLQIVYSGLENVKSLITILTTKMKFKLFLLFTTSLCIASSRDKPSEALSFYQFRGPVSGPISQKSVPSHYKNKPSLDYVAKPDYHYIYGVEDPGTGNSQTHAETRDGDAITGEYKVLQADGVVRIVEYTADDTNGFRANIRYEES